MTKKLLAVLTLVALVAICMTIPAMAADAIWTLDAKESTVIEGEHFFSNVTEKPSPTPTKWKNSDGTTDFTKQLSNGYLYYAEWESKDTYTYDLKVDAPYAGYYDLEYVANTLNHDFSDIQFHVAGVMVDSVKTNGSHTATSYEKFLKCDMAIYKKSDIVLDKGLNIIEVNITNDGKINKWAMDYIKFTPGGREAEIPFEVTRFEDNTLNPTCLSLYFSKDITSVEGITVTGYAEGTPSITIDANNSKKVKITGVAGRTTITVPADFTGGTGEVIGEAITKQVFAYPFADTESDTDVLKEKCNTTAGIIRGSIGSKAGMMDINWYAILAVYDGDKLVGSASKYVWGNPMNTIEVILGEGVKFTEAKMFSLWNVNDEWIPLDKPTTKTAAELGFKFE